MQEVRAEYKHDKLEFLKQRCYAIDFAGIMQEKNISKEDMLEAGLEGLRNAIHRHGFTEDDWRDPQRRKVFLRQYGKTHVSG
eukprot:jgi/Chrzof1/6343/Cz18g05020.t1